MGSGVKPRHVVRRCLVSSAARWAKLLQSVAVDTPRIPNPCGVAVVDNVTTRGLYTLRLYRGYYWQRDLLNPAKLPRHSVRHVRLSHLLTESQHPMKESGGDFRRVIVDGPVWLPSDLKYMKINVKCNSFILQIYKELLTKGNESQI